MSRVSYKSESQEKMKQNIKLLDFQSSKFDQPDVIESNYLKYVEEYLEISRNI